MFKKIATRALLDGLVLAGIASLPTGDAKAWIVYRTWTWHYYYVPRVYVAPVRACVPGHFNYAGFWVPAHCW
jgi:hypothetical protein